MTRADRQKWLLADVSRRLLDCSLDELRVLGVILARLELGRERYGYLDLSREGRDFKRERAEEYVDAAIYDACDELARADEQRALEQRDAEVTEPRPRVSIADFDHSDGD